ncbi:hypothetical protein PHMEG_00010500 [Phytophthora megakarya]|uniref:Reverse transcriptase n=1 Tax=Phytophthora megakarya TaxID=4795 RepID=A0A225WDI7_9STRA|nr:hypothetical protein PHMEG_00010500 [Phytophthora megakarya]
MRPNIMVRGETEGKAHGLALLRQPALDRARIRLDHELVQVKRDWNGSGASLASTALQLQCGVEFETDGEIQDLITLNRLDEILIAKSEALTVQFAAVTTRSKTRSGVRSGSNSRVLCEEAAQGEEAWIYGLKNYLAGKARDLTQEEVRSYGSIAMDC